MLSFARHATLFLLACAGVGCSGPNAFTLSGVGDRFLQSLGMAEPPGRSIQRIDAIWKAAKGHDMKGMPCRGAAGQILFFSSGGDVPVKLVGEGHVVIYVFDNLGKPNEQAKPLHKFVFDMGSWNRHLRVGGQLGPTYNVFIPYTRNVVTAAQMSIAVILEPKRGPRAYSSPINVALPGPNPKLATKLQVVSEPSRKKVNVATFKPDEYLNGSKVSGAPSADQNKAGRQPRSSAEFHDFDLSRKTQVRSLGPVQQAPAGMSASREDIRAKQNEQLKKLLAAFPTQPGRETPGKATVGDRRDKPAAAPRSFRLAPAPSEAKDRGVVTAGHEREAARPERPANAPHPLLDERAAGPQN
jgi:hypothetical protein